MPWTKGKRLWRPQKFLDGSKIARLREAGRSWRKIASAMECSPELISGVFVSILFSWSARCWVFPFQFPAVLIKCVFELTHPDAVSPRSLSFVQHFIGVAEQFCKTLLRA